MKKDKDADKTDKMDVNIQFKFSLSNWWKEKNNNKLEWKIQKILFFQVFYHLIHSNQKIWLFHV